jgi:restriction system protein
MFIGRQNEIAKIEDFVFKSKRQFLYIYGKRGIGKTSLIYQFIQKNKKRLDNKVLTLNAFNFDSLPNDFLNSDKDLLIIDDYYEFSGDNAVSIALPTSSLRNIIDNSKAKKVILLSPEPPLFFNNSLQGRADFLEIPPFSNQDLDNLFKVAFNEERYINFNDFYNYFDNNPRSILTALNYYKHSNFEKGIDFLDFLNKPIKQSGLVDINGNPFSSETAEKKLITETIKVINNSLVEKVNSNPSLIFQITPRNFEELVAELLEKEGFKVNLTKKTRDGGKDIFVAQKNNLGNFLYYVECKQYAPENPVGVNLVRELYGTISADRATAGLLVTSSYFTKDAISFTQNIQHQLSLKGYIDLKQWITEICKK